MDEKRKEKIFSEVKGSMHLGIGIYLMYMLIANSNADNVGIFGGLLYDYTLVTFGLIAYLLPLFFSAYGLSLILNRRFSNTQMLSMFTFAVSFSSLLVMKDLVISLKSDRLSLPPFAENFDYSFLFYLIPSFLIFFIILITLMKNTKVNKRKIFTFGITILLIIVLLFINRGKLSKDGGEILKEIIAIAGNRSSGGLLGGLFSLPFFFMFGINGSFIFLILFTIISALVFTNVLVKNLLVQIYNVIKVILAVILGVFMLIINKFKVIFGLKHDIDVDKNIEFKNSIEEPKKKEIDYILSKKSNFFDVFDKKIENDSINSSAAEILKEAKQLTLGDIFKNEERKEIKEQLLNSIKKKRQKLEEVLNEYGVDGKVVNCQIGPTISRFELMVSTGTRVKSVVALTDDIAMHLEAKSIRIEAPIPGKNTIGIEIPNDDPEEVTFSSIINSPELKKSKSPLNIILGKDIVGEDIAVDLRKMPHLLIAGRTGAGKSVCVNCIISSIICKATPAEVRFIMIDPKMVELMPYNDIPHLYVPVIVSPKKAALALKWVVREMERRYTELAKVGVRNIEGYNIIADAEKLPYIVVFIDELADLMMIAPASIEESIARVAQKARAVGIHLVVATQRPSVDVITGTIKANLPSRIAFAVASQIDSRTIIDTPGAEKLLGRGDMLYLESGKPNLVRIQGAYISDEEVTKLTDCLKNNGEPCYRDDIILEEDESDKDELYSKAIEILEEESRISTSLIQRKLKIGYSRAARIIDQLERDGVLFIDENGDKKIIK